MESIFKLVAGSLVCLVASIAAEDGSGESAEINTKYDRINSSAYSLYSPEKKLDIFFSSIRNFNLYNFRVCIENGVDVNAIGSSGETSLDVVNNLRLGSSFLSESDSINTVNTYNKLLHREYDGIDLHDIDPMVYAMMLQEKIDDNENYRKKSSIYSAMKEALVNAGAKKFFFDLSSYGLTLITNSDSLMKANHKRKKYYSDGRRSEIEVANHYTYVLDVPQNSPISKYIRKGDLIYGLKLQYNMNKDVYVIREGKHIKAFKITDFLNEIALLKR